MATYGVNLVHKDDARRVAFGLVEQVPHPRGANTHKHLDEFRARDRKERHAGFTGHSFGQQGLARTRCSHQDHALGDPCTQRDKLLRFLEELDDLCQLLFCFLHTSHIVKGNSRFLTGEHPGPALAKGECLVVRPLCLAHQEEKDHPQQNERQKATQVGQPFFQQAGGFDLQIDFVQRFGIYPQSQQAFC